MAEARTVWQSVRLDSVRGRFISGSRRRGVFLPSLHKPTSVYLRKHNGSITKSFLTTNTPAAWGGGQLTLGYTEIIVSRTRQETKCRYLCWKRLTNIYSDARWRINFTAIFQKLVLIYRKA